MRKLFPLQALAQGGPALSSTMSVIPLGITTFPVKTFPVAPLTTWIPKNRLIRKVLFRIVVLVLPLSRKKLTRKFSPGWRSKAPDLEEHEDRRTAQEGRR